MNEKKILSNLCVVFKENCTKKTVSFSDKSEKKSKEVNMNGKKIFSSLGRFIKENCTKKTVVFSNKSDKKSKYGFEIERQMNFYSDDMAIEVINSKEFDPKMKDGTMFRVWDLRLKSFVYNTSIDGRFCKDVYTFVYYESGRSHSYGMIKEDFHKMLANYEFISKLESDLVQSEKQNKKLKI